LPFVVIEENALSYIDALLHHAGEVVNKIGVEQSYKGSQAID
jgi:hypothetical protein